MDVIGLLYGEQGRGTLHSEAAILPQVGLLCQLSQAPPQGAHLVLLPQRRLYPLRTRQTSSQSINLHEHAGKHNCPAQPHTRHTGLAMPPNAVLDAARRREICMAPREGVVDTC